MIALVMDTETSGLIENHTIKLDKQAEIIEFYGALTDLSDGTILREVNNLIKPVTPLSDKPPPKSKKTISEITGITNEMLAGQPSFRDVASEIVDFIESSPVVIAHNVSFDMEMIDIELERIKRRVIWPRAICTVEQTVFLQGKRMSLTRLHEYLFQEPFPDAHRAKPDTQALIRCCVELEKRGIL